MTPVTTALTFRGILSSELLKMTSLNALRLTALASVGAGVLGAVVQDAGRGDVSSAVVGATVFSALVVGLLGAMAGSSEYATGSIGSSLMAVPRRATLLAAKLLVSAGSGAALLFISSLGGILTVGAALSPDAIVACLGAALTGASVGAVATAIALLARRPLAALIAVLLLVLIVPGMIGGVKVGGVWLTDYLPTEAGAQLAIGASASSVATALVALFLWPLVAAIAALIRLVRTDA